MFFLSTNFSNKNSKWPICSPARWIVERRPQRLSSSDQGVRYLNFTKISEGLYPWFLFGMNPPILLKHRVWIGHSYIVIVVVLNTRHGSPPISNLDLWSANFTISSAISASCVRFRFFIQVSCQNSLPSSNPPLAAPVNVVVWTRD